MGIGSIAARGDGFLAQRLERAFDLVLRRRVGMRDWVLALVVVSIAQITGTNAIAWLPFCLLLAITALALGSWFWVFPRQEPSRALKLEAWMNGCTALAACFLVAVSGGPESPYVFFYALLIVFIAAFVERASVRVGLIALAAVCALLPIAYDWNAAVSSDFIPTITIAVAVWLVTGALVALKRSSAIAAELAARRLAYVDQLTGAANRRGIEQCAEDLDIARLPYALVIVQVGGIDEINRTLGHFVGDEVLRRVTASMRDASIEIDQVARLSGAEFAVILPGADLEGAERWRSRFRERLEIANAAAEDGAQASAAAGCAARAGAPGDFAELLAEADANATSVAEGATTPGVPADPVERVSRLREQIELYSAEQLRVSLASVDAPTSIFIALPAAALLGAAVATTGGASSVLFSFAILLVAYFATFGSRMEAALTTISVLIAGLVAVLLNTPVSSTDQTRVLTIFVTVAVLADTVQRSSRMLTVAERRAAELSLVDPLTGLANRSAFERDLVAMLPRAAQTAVSREQRIDGPPAVVALDLSEFQEARSELGHADAELLLKEVAEALRDAMGAEGTVYRIGGAEFATIIRAHHVQHVETVGARCAGAVQGVDSDGRYAERGVTVECRIGGAIWQSGLTAADLAAAAIAKQAAAAPTPGFEPVAS